MMVKKLFICFYALLFLSSISLRAQKTDTANSQFPEEAKVALLHNYFLPAQALAYQKELNLTTEQVNKLKGIQAILQLKKSETDISAFRNEHMLDSLFRTNRVNDGVIIFYTNRYGLYEGEYRGAVLLACYNTRKVLTPAQVKKLADLQNHN